MEQRSSIWVNKTLFIVHRINELEVIGFMDYMDHGSWLLSLVNNLCNGNQHEWSQVNAE